MNQPLAHGVIILAVALAIVGAAATSTDWEPVEGQALQAPAGTVLGSETFIAVASRSDVPIRSALLSDDVVSDDIKPVAVRVAGIGLEASVISVGVDSNNQFAVPTADTVGWYQYSAAPGNPGASVLAAHVDYGGVPGAFFNLRKVLPGDTLEVELEDGTIILYEVTDNTLYEKIDLPAGELFRKDGDSVLQLITCGGTFNPEEHSYDANIVVTAIPISV